MNSYFSCAPIVLVVQTFGQLILFSVCESETVLAKYQNPYANHKVTIWQFCQVEARVKSNRYELFQGTHILQLINDNSNINYEIKNCLLLKKK